MLIRRRFYVLTAPHWEFFTIWLFPEGISNIVTLEGGWELVIPFSAEIDEFEKGDGFGY